MPPVTAGSIFRSVSKWGIVGDKGLDPASVNTILAYCEKAAGLDYAPEFSSHSLRRGMATSAYRAGADERRF